MGSITATNSSTATLQAAVTRSRLEQAQREAAQAESKAETLRAQAQEQDLVAAKAHQRERNLYASQVGASAPSSPSPAVAAPLSRTPKVAGQNGASYVETLSTVLEGDNSPAKAEYTYPTQKNLVLSNLFQRANAIWQATPPASQVAQLYAGKGATVAVTGSVLSVEA